MASNYSTDAQAWLQWADHTYAGARMLFHSGNAFLWFPAAILGHQALEMYLKAALITSGHQVARRRRNVWGHDLVALADKLAAELPVFPSQVKKDLQVFTDCFNELRYPTKLVNVAGLGEDEGHLLDRLVRILRPYAEGKRDRAARG